MILRLSILLSFMFAAVTVWSFPSDMMSALSGQMPLRGEGIKRVLWKKVLKASLYAPGDVTPEKILGTHPKCIEVKYYVSIPGQKLTSFIAEKMVENAGRLSAEALQPDIRLLASILPDIHPGDSLAMCYEPSAGTSFIYNDFSKGMIVGDDFAAVIFATWLGDYPVDFRLKDDLLGVEMD